MERKGWYLVAYDIADPRRLAKVHRLMKDRGLAVQKSLFFVKGTESKIDSLLDRITSIMVVKEDDLRAYPISHPSEVWTNGPNPLADFPVLPLGASTSKKKISQGKGKRSGWKRLLGL